MHPVLPYELVWKICEFAAVEDFSIALLSRSIQRLVDPIIYTHYSIADYSDFKRFFSIIHKNRIPHRRPISDHIRTLYLEFAYTMIDEVVRACAQLQRLAIYVWTPPMNIYLPLPAPTEICILYDTAVVDLRSPLFRAVTHLNVGRAPPSLDDLAIISTYPRLTHFGFQFRDRTESTEETIEIVARLLNWLHLKAVCVEVSKGNALPDSQKIASIWSRLAVFNDQRLRVIPSLLIGTHDEQRRQFLNGHGIWERYAREG